MKTRDTVFNTSNHIKVFATVGSFQVPENRNNKNSRLITIDFIQLKSTSSNPKEPLLYLEGGGSPSTQQAYSPQTLNKWLPYLEVSDVILYDQRGTTDRNLLWISDISYPENFLVDAETAGSHWRKMGTKALQAFKERAVDVTGYNPIESAHDIETLRKKLNIEKISILGFSYGTHLGLTLIKLYPESIENAVLAGVDGMNQYFNYPKLLDDHYEKVGILVEEDKEVRKEVPNWKGLLKLVMNQLDANPMQVKVNNPLTGESMNVKVGSFGLSIILRLDIDDTSDIPVIPRLLYSIQNNDASLLQWFVQKRIVFAFAVPGNGINQAIAAGASERRWKKIKRQAKRSPFGDVVNFPFSDVKDIWPHVDLGDDFRKNSKNNVRTLFLSGEWDCRTPPSQAENLRASFKKDIAHLIVRNAGHEQILNHPLAIKTIIQFLGDKPLTDFDVFYDDLKLIPLTGSSKEIFHPSINTNKN
jgi:pimeloyl-ACP methyl ester carboxylesterase